MRSRASGEYKTTGGVVASDILLEGLRDIHVPPPVGWWPPAPGWWILAVVGAVLFLSCIHLWRAAAYRREAYQEWRGLVARRATISEFNGLLKRVAISRYGREACADLYGRSWGLYLNKKCRSPVFDDKALSVLNSIYSGHTEEEGDEEFYRSVLVWLKRHR